MWNYIVLSFPSYHTKVIFCPEREIEKERLEANRDLKMTVERLAMTHGPRAVLHNLSFAKPLAEEFRKNHGKYCRWDFLFYWAILWLIIKMFNIFIHCMCYKIFDVTNRFDRNKKQAGVDLSQAQPKLGLWILLR